MNSRILQFFNGVPIKRKLMILIMVTTSAALLLAGAAILIFEHEAFRDDMATNFKIIADTFDDNVASGLTFKDPESIVVTLSTFRANPSILGACVYDKDGTRVAAYQRDNSASPFPFPGSKRTHQLFEGARLHTYQDITLAGEVIGCFYIASDLDAISQRIRQSAFVVSAIMSGSLVMAFVLSTGLQTVISRPISHLAEIASRVALEKDYSVRAAKQSDDELGSLIDAFNEMLGQIQVQDAALHSARSNLEIRVHERTSELARSVSLLNATLDSTADGIIAIQFTGEVVCYNSQFADMWNVPEELLNKPNAGVKLRTFLASKTTDPEEFFRRAGEMETGIAEPAYDLIRLQSGKTFERYVKPQQVDGKQVGLVINFRDTTAREQASAELAAANARLLATSRQAGMAEVATSILHNVGNVLNSVSVSAEVVSTKVRQFRIGSLKSLSDLLSEHSGDLAGFLTADPRGKEVPAYLLKLVGRLAEPQQGILNELDLLRKNIEHIKEIVAMQQSYARGSGVLEKLSVSELIEDAVRINAAGFNRHELLLKREIEDMPLFMTDRHKVLQILVNLLGNAKYALSDAVDKQLIVRVTVDERGCLNIAVIDNGVGIAPENLTRIFQHGFTTKKDGHGFGLHSGALAASELGGRLVAYSAGLGLGATFTLELPPPAQEAQQ